MMRHGRALRFNPGAGDCWRETAEKEGTPMIAKRWRLGVAAVVSTWLAGAGCGGVRFADVALNKDLPADYKNRVLWPQTDAFKYNLTQLAGHVIVGDPKTGEFERGPRYIKEGYEPKLGVIEDGAVYNSKVTNSAAANANYLAFAAKLSNDEAAEVTIVDTNDVFIPYEQIPHDALAEEARKPAPEGRAKYYVQGVLLATITIKNYHKIEADASAVAGNTFGGGGKVFNEANDVSKDFKISLTLIPVSSFGRARAASPADLSRQAVAGGFVVNSIAGLPRARP
jgi:hypothetical protein